MEQNNNTISAVSGAIPISSNKSRIKDVKNTTDLDASFEKEI